MSIIVLGALVACGPSSKEVAGAKTAHYKGDKLTLFATTKAVVETKYKLQKSDETSLGMQTIGRWYSPEGQLAMEGNPGVGLRNAEQGGGKGLFPDNSINLILVVTMLPDGDSWVVKITPIMERYHAGSPKTEPLKEDDISVPGWAHGKVDELAMEIHNALAKYEIKGVPQSVPAGGNTATPPPDEPAQGSAAGPSAQAPGSAAPAKP